MATTLATLLIKLGFDLSSLASGGGQAQSIFGNVAKSAAAIAPQAQIATAALASLNNAVDRVQGIASFSSMRSLATAARDVSNAAAGAPAALNNFARSANVVSEATAGSAVELNAYARATSLVAAQSKGSVPIMIDFARGAAMVASAVGEEAGGMAFLESALKKGVSSHNAVALAMMQVRFAAQAEAEANALDANSFMNLDQAALRASTGVNNVGMAAVRSAAELRELAASESMAADRGSFLNRTLSMAFAFSGGVAVTTLFGFLSNAVVGFNTRLEQARITFNTLLGDSSKADAFIKKMEDFANITPFSFDTLQTAVKRMLAMGFAADSVLPALRAVGDAVSALGGGDELIDRVTRALGEMLTAGRANSRDLRQLTQAGIPAWQMLADAAHKSIGEIRKDVEKGTISSATTINVLLTGMETRFAGMMQRQQRTMQGAFSTIRDVMLQTVSTAVEPLFNAVRDGMVGVADFLIAGGGKYIVPAIQAIGAAVALFIIPRLWGVVEAATAASISIQGISTAVVKIPFASVLIALTVLATAWQEDFGGIRESLGPVVKAVGDFAGAVLKLAADSGLLVPIITFVAAVITTKFVFALIAAGLAMVGDFIVAVGLNGAFSAMAVDAGAAAVSVGRFGAITGATLPLIGGVVGLMALWVGIIAVVATKWDDLSRGIGAAAFLIVAAIKAIADAMLRLAGTPDAVIKQVDAFFNGILDNITKRIYDLGDKINAASAQAATVAGAGTEALDRILTNFQFDPSKIVADQTDDTLVGKFGMTLQGVVDAAQESGAKAMTEMAKAISDNQQGPIDAFVELGNQLKNALTPMQQATLDVGILQSQRLADGLASGIPAVRAAAYALQQTTLENLGNMGYAYEAGRLYANAYEAGIASGKLYGPPSPNPMGKDVTPSLSDINAQMDAMNKKLEDSTQWASQLKSAFSDISQTAHAYFSQLHQDNLQAIDDALRQKNAILDAKEALNQAPVTAAQKALDYQRRVIEEWRLRNAVATAQTPEQYRDAVLALQDFLAQQKINDMQALVDGAKDKIEAQKKANEDQAAAAKDAENKRYADQVAAFDRDMRLLEANMLAQHDTWQTGEEKITKLLKGYGVTYGNIGKTLGLTFVANLKDQLDAAYTALGGVGAALIAAGAALMGANAAGTGTQPVGGATGGGIKPSSTPVPLDTGAWSIMQNELLAYVHKGEMVVPATVASQLRKAMLSGQFGDPRDGGSTFGANVSGFARTMHSEQPITRSGHGTVVLKVGDEMLGEITDRRLSVQDDIYSADHQLNLASQR